MAVKCTYEDMSEKDFFVNPYNFVDTNFSNKQTESIYDIKKEDLLTGRIHCTITARTPIAIPDTEIEQPEGKHKEYTFMSYPDGKHFIPASSIRGVIRSVFETASDSCFSTTRDNTFLDERLSATKGPQVNAGILYRKNNDWELYAATRYMLRTKTTPGKNSKNKDAWDDTKCPAYNLEQDSDGRYINVSGAKIRDGHEVRFTRLTDHTGKDVVYISKKDKECAPIASRVFPATFVTATEKGYLVIGEPIFNKHHISIFKVDLDTDTPLKFGADVLDRAYQGLKRTVELYNDSGVNRNLKPQKSDSKHLGYAAFERMAHKGCIPVWYIIENSQLYLMMANIGRRAFYKTLNEHLDKKAPCKDRKALCPACCLFGMAGKVGNSVGSRVRFTDAVCETEGLIHDQKTMLAELGKPRTSYMPFYSRTINGEYRTTSGYDSKNVTIRGRKYYWHSKNFNEINRNVAETERNASMELADAGSRFSFDIYYDGITDLELKQLVWSINFYENKEDGIMCHKIGHGKPIGLGSVKICVDSINKRIFDEKGYRIEPYVMVYDKELEPFAQTDSLKQLKTILNFDSCESVSYPYVKPVDAQTEEAVRAGRDDNALANHRWFTENKSGGQHGHNHEVQMLKEIPVNGDVSSQQRLFAYMAKLERDKRSDSRNDVVWIGRYGLKRDFRVKAVGERYVQYVKGDPNNDNIVNNSKQYRVIMLPSYTAKELIDLAMVHYQEVWVATKSKSSRYDDGWKKMK